MTLAYEVELGEGVFVAVGISNVIDGPNVAYRSVDGLGWTEITLPDAEDVEFGRDIYVAVSSQGSVAVSTDGGLSWALNSPNNGALRDVAYRP
jgi:hypothetical protein